MKLSKYQAAQKKHNFIAWLAVKHHRTHKDKPLDFKYHQYLKGILLDESQYQIDKKSTQSGHSEIAMVRINAKAIMGLNVFCVWPTDTLLLQFVQNRYNKSLAYTKYYKSLLRINKESDTKAVDSTHMKDIGDGNVYFVPSFTETAFTSYPADMIDIEEMAECHPENIKMARERLDHSEHRLQYKRGNPKFNGMDIDAEFDETDQKEWGIKCECNEWIFLDWFKHVVRQVDKGRYELLDNEFDIESGRDINALCHKCNRPVYRKSKGLWIPTYPGRRKSGRHTSKLFAGTSPLVEIYQNFNDGLIDDQIMQRFYNADLGLAYTAEGAKISEQMIFDCIQDYAPGKEPGLIIAGVDVGKFYHYIIMRVLPDGTFQTLLINKTMDTDTLVNTLKEYRVKVGVIDALPETREARKICNQFKLFFLCYFGNTKNDTTDLARKTITVQRTPALDAVKEAVLTRAVQFPYNTKSNGEFIRHLTVSVRALNEKRNCYEWVNGALPDHYFLAMAYALIAKRLILLLRG